MRPSAVIALIVLAALAMLGPAFVVISLPYVPNWPYVGAVCLAVSVVAGGVYLLAARRHLDRPSPITMAWLLRVFPLWLSAFALFSSFVRFTVEKVRSLEFSHGVVVEKYRSHNHGYLSARVQVEGRGTLEVEGISPTAWEMISSGSKVSKRCGTTDVVVDRP